MHINIIPTSTPQQCVYEISFTLVFMEVIHNFVLSKMKFIFSQFWNCFGDASLRLIMPPEVCLCIYLSIPRAESGDVCRPMYVVPLLSMAILGMSTINP